MLHGLPGGAVKALADAELDGDGEGEADEVAQEEAREEDLALVDGIVERFDPHGNNHAEDKDGERKGEGKVKGIAPFADLARLAEGLELGVVVFAVGQDSAEALGFYCFGNGADANEGGGVGDSALGVFESDRCVVHALNLAEDRFQVVGCIPCMQAVQIKHYRLLLEVSLLRVDRL